MSLVFLNSQGLIRDVTRALGLLRPRDRRVLFLLMVFQSSLSLIDLVAIAALGVATVGASALAAGRPAATPPAIEAVIGPVTQPSTLVLVATVAGVMMVGKSIISFWGTRRSFRFLANRQAQVSARLADELLSRPLLQVTNRSTQETSYALTGGVFSITVGILGSLVIIVTEISLTLVLLVGLLLIDPILTVFTAGFFFLIALLLYFLLANWAIRIGRKQGQSQAAGTALIQEAIRGYREVVVAGRRGVYTREFHRLMWDVARVSSDRLMVSSIGKYVFELALIVGAALLILSQLPRGDFVASSGTVVVFLAAASRIMPSLLRLQAGALEMKLAVGAGGSSWTLIDDLNRSEAEPGLSATELARMYSLSNSGYDGFASCIRASHLTLVYPEASEPALQEVNLTVDRGTSLALVGPSGAGKSSLVDVILGVISPTSGDVRISDLSPSECIRRWPGALGYVPQDIAVVNGSVRANVAMGLPPDLVDDSRVWEALDRAQLASFVKDHDSGLDLLVGEHGMKLSGGQRQRLGIARALYTRPQLLVLDEATSALDAQTESAIAETIMNMSGAVTRIIVAHRLATIRNCDQVAYLDHGQVLAMGSFSHVRNAIPDFDHQAQLLGL